MLKTHSIANKGALKSLYLELFSDFSFEDDLRLSSVLEFRLSDEKVNWNFWELPSEICFSLPIIRCEF